MWVLKPSTISNQRRLFRIMLGKDDISLRWNNIWFFLLFEDKGRLQACCNGIKSWLLPGQSLSNDIERDCHLTGIKSRFCHSWLGLFNYWIGHNYPVPSSPPHAPRSGAHWPNRMEYFTPSPLETNLWFQNSHFFKRCSLFFFRRQFSISSRIFHLGRLRNISFFQLHGIRTKMVVTVRTRYNGLFLEQHETHSNIFQLIQNNTIYYTN